MLGLAVVLGLVSWFGSGFWLLLGLQSGPGSGSGSGSGRTYVRAYVRALLLLEAVETMLKTEEGTGGC